MKKIYWLTGLPCSGKTTIAKELERYLYAEILDGDKIRNLTSNAEFTKENRATHMAYVAAMAHYLSKHIDVIVSLVSPIRSARNLIKEQYQNVYEIYVKCDLDVCKERDTKGMYARAEKGKIKNFTGIQQKYEEPLNPDMIVKTDENTIEECINQILTLHQNKPKALLPGRWQVKRLHKGHKWLVAQVKKMGHIPLLAIRNTPIGPNNPYSVRERIDTIYDEFGESVDYMVLPDIVGIYYGRKVGYEVKELKAPTHIASISATKIRESIQT
jgi:adenylylsulfate kinase